MAKVTLTNDFHNSQVVVQLKGSFLTEYQTKRAKTALCGISGCTCSGATGIRGTQTDVKIIGQEYLGGNLVPRLVLNSAGNPAC